MSVENTENMADNNDSKIYELGFHLVPTLPEESVAVEFSNIKSLIEKEKGHFVSEDFPKMRVLAYSITKKIKATNHTFDRAYFGWVKFEAEPIAIENLKKQLDLSDVMLRYIIIKTVKENTLYAQRAVYVKSATPKKDDATEGIDDVVDVPVIADITEPTDIAEPMSEAEIDKTIDSLVIN